MMKVSGMLKNAVQISGAGIFPRGKLIHGELDGAVVWVVGPRTGKRVGIPVSDWKGVEEVKPADAAPKKKPVETASPTGQKAA